MKKVLMILILGVMVFGVVACGENSESSNGKTTSSEKESSKNNESNDKGNINKKTVSYTCTRNEIFKFTYKDGELVELIQSEPIDEDIKQSEIDEAKEEDKFISDVYFENIDGIRVISIKYDMSKPNSLDELRDILGIYIRSNISNPNNSTDEDTVNSIIKDSSWETLEPLLQSWKCVEE